MIEHLLLMLLHSTRKPPPKVQGSCIKEVTCANCACRYVYYLQRSATGQASGFYLSQATANQAASEKALKNLQKRLDRECDPHPCPDCGFYQPDMVRVLKRRHRPLMMKTGLAVAVLSAAYVLVYMSANAWRKPLPYWGLLAVEFGVMLMVAAWFMRLWHDPNADAQSRAQSRESTVFGPFRIAEFRRMIKESPELARSLRSTPTNSWSPLP